MIFQKALAIKKTVVASSLALGISTLIGCSATSDRGYMVESSDADDYVYILDYDRIAKIEAASNTSHSNVETVWINPPVKRIKRSELEAMQKK